MTKKILIIEDIEPVKKVIEKIISRYNFDVVWADNTDKALKEVENNRFDIFFIDLHLNDGKNGISLGSKIKKEIPDAFYVAVTGFDSIDTFKKCRLAGFDDYLKKPFNTNEIINVVNNAVITLDRWSEITNETLN
jgi:DNA-binding NtrC family response regulator